MKNPKRQKGVIFYLKRRGKRKTQVDKLNGEKNRGLSVETIYEMIREGHERTNECGEEKTKTRQWRLNTPSLWRRPAEASHSAALTNSYQGLCPKQRVWVWFFSFLLFFLFLLNLSNFSTI